MERTPSSDQVKARPFLKWAGGKQALVKVLLEHVPQDINTYYEPFLGAGSLFFSMPAGMKKHVADFNSELISVYETVRDNLPLVLQELQALENTKEKYIEVRGWDRETNFKNRHPAQRAARFIFLNKLGFNGLYRLNSSGYYNVPYGRPVNIDFISSENLLAVSSFLNAKDTTGRLTTNMSSGDYSDLVTNLRGPENFVYFDPPYHPISSTSSFVSYNENGFNVKDQEQLHDLILNLTKNKVRVLLSNSDTEFIRNLYTEPCFTQHRIPVRRAIAAKSQSRGTITELLIDNYAQLERQK
jgi:DNA adenine methylase